MKKKFFGFLCILVFPIAISLATPPVRITLNYDLANKVLHVVAVHPTSDLRKSYVRQMIVYVNGAQVSTQDYSRQAAYNEFTNDVSITAHVGDVIKVDLFCSLGGEMAQELTVTNLKN